jgi:RimJ/RimL family protein N-acetyltransferase
VARYQSWDAFGPDEAEQFIAGQLGLHPDTPGTWFQLAIVAGAVVGDCGLHFRADDALQAEIGVTLDPTHQGRGYATEALGCVLDYLFLARGKHRVTATTDAENERAAGLLARLGFRREGHFVQNVWSNGRWGDEFSFALLRDEWERRRADG